MNMRAFVDLQVYTVDSGGKSTADEYASFLSILGFKYVSFVCFNRPNKDKFKEYRRSVEDYGLEYVNRVDLEVSSLSRAKSFLRRYRRDVDIIVVRPRNINAARFSARDRRVDMVFFDEKSPKFDVIQARLMSINNKVLEISLNEILVTENRVMEIKRLNKVLRTALGYGIKIVLSSGAHSVYEIRAPRDMISVIKTLSGIKIKNEFEMMRDNPLDVIFKSKERRKREFVMPGVRIVGRGEPYEVKEKILNFLD